MQQLSQFWYNNDTKEKLALVVDHFKEIFASEAKELRVALLSSPSLYHHVKGVAERGKLYIIKIVHLILVTGSQLFEIILVDEASFPCFEIRGKSR